MAFIYFMKDWDFIECLGFFLLYWAHILLSRIWFLVYLRQEGLFSFFRQSFELFYIVTPCPCRIRPFERRICEIIIRVENKNGRLIIRFNWHKFSIFWQKILKFLNYTIWYFFWINSFHGLYKKEWFEIKNNKLKVKDSK